MKSIVILCALVALVVARPDGATYDSRYDSFNAQELVENTRLLKAYGNCFLDKGPCTPEGSEFKKTIPEALRSTCGKCTPRQRELIRIVCRGFQQKLPEVWEELVNKHDPTLEYKAAFDKFLSSSD